MSQAASGNYICTLNDLFAAAIFILKQLPGLPVLLFYRVPRHPVRTLAVPELSRWLWWCCQVQYKSLSFSATRSNATLFDV
jgi:hypothetical protein